jgi:hypothetical protein
MASSACKSCRERDLRVQAGLRRAADAEKESINGGQVTVRIDAQEGDDRAQEDVRVYNSTSVKYSCRGDGGNITMQGHEIGGPEETRHRCENASTLSSSLCTRC